MTDLSEKTILYTLEPMLNGCFLRNMLIIRPIDNNKTIIYDFELQAVAWLWNKINKNFMSEIWKSD